MTRVEAFMTGTSINTLFSFVNFIVFRFVLAYYDWTILGLFWRVTAYTCVVLAFARWRRELDVKRFSQASGREQSNLFQLITRMQEIKLNNCRDQDAMEMGTDTGKTFQIGIKGWR